MKTTMQEYADKFRLLVGDSSMNTSDKFIIEGFNWAISGLPLVPKLGKLFSRHYTVNLNANNHYRWKLNKDFRRITDITAINFFTTKGGDLCKLRLCNMDTNKFYNKHGVVELKKPGIPCEYTIEQEGDNIYLVLDRPSNVAIIIDYIACGFPKPVKSMDDKIELSAIAEHLIFHALREVWFQEADDWAFAGAVGDYLDNKLIPEATQMLNKRWGSSKLTIIGEA